MNMLYYCDICFQKECENLMLHWSSRRHSFFEISYLTRFLTSWTVVKKLIASFQQLYKAKSFILRPKKVNNHKWSINYLSLFSWLTYLSLSIFLLNNFCCVINCLKTNCVTIYRAECLGIANLQTICSSCISEENNTVSSRFRK